MGAEKGLVGHPRWDPESSERPLKASGLVAWLEAVVDRGAESEMALLVVREAEGRDRRVLVVATEDVGGSASSLRHQYVHRCGAAIVAAGGACLVAGMGGEIVGGTSRKA